MSSADGCSFSLPSTALRTVGKLPIERIFCSKSVNGYAVSKHEQLRIQISFDEYYFWRCCGPRSRLFAFSIDFPFCYWWNIHRLFIGSDARLFLLPSQTIINRSLRLLARSFLQYKILDLYQKNVLEHSVERRMITFLMILIGSSSLNLWLISDGIRWVSLDWYALPIAMEVCL